MDIQKLRKEKGISQRELAEALGINPTLISHYENKTKKPSPKRLQEIEDYLVALPDKYVLVSRETTLNRSRSQRERLNVYAKQILFATRDSDNCALCKQPAPFKLPDGRPYLEMHHIVPMSEGGQTVVENVVFLCPNCHRKIHTLKDPKDIMALKAFAKEGK